MLGLGLGLGMTARQAASGGGGGGDSDPHFANVVLLCGFDGTDGATTAADDSDSAHAITFNGTAQIDTAKSMFGGASLYLDGSSGCTISIPHSADFIFDGDFTIEIWASHDAATTQCIFSKYDTGSARSIEAEATSTGTIVLRLSTNGTSVGLTLTSSATAINDGDFHHVCFERSGTTVRTYVDGAMVASGTLAGALFNNSTISLVFGDRQAGTLGNWVGHMDEPRITKGVARYASDAGFDVPTAAYPRS